MTWPIPMKRLPSAKDMKASAMYEAGATMMDCAAFLGLSKAQTRVRLVRAGTTMRARGHQAGTPWRKAA